jgi:poly(3-hydroxybutyrate) depolymerase
MFPGGNRMNHRRILLVSVLALSPVCCTASNRITFEITFAGDDRPDPTLNGILTLPAGTGPFPAVVLLHGCSGLIRPIYRPWVKRFLDKYLE